VLVAVALLAGACGEPASPQTRLVLIVADDLGYADLGIHGSREIRTPHIDALARSGVRFRQGYSSAPLCAPMRAGLLTGRDANRFGYTKTTGSYAAQIRGDVGVPTSEVLLSERLRARGYASGAFGKWHLGVNAHYRPLARGFDAFFGVLAGAHRYFDWGPGVFGPVFRGDEPVAGNEYLTDAIAKEAARFVAQNRERPFFLYVAFTAIHAPWQAPPERLAEYRELEPASRRAIAAMTSALDAGVGRILAAIADAGLERDTLVAFVNDNGGLLPHSRNTPLRGGKGSLLEGGIRVPFFLRWPAVLPAGVVNDFPVSTLDLFPTLLAAAGADAPADGVDGVDLLPYLTGEADGVPHEALHWRSGNQRAIRRGRWKLVDYREVPMRDPEPRTALFDLAEDVGELRDERDRHPEVAHQLERDLAAWTASLPPAR
jgi:arylsulfatase A-like enzyme